VYVGAIVMTRRPVQYPCSMRYDPDFVICLESYPNPCGRVALYDGRHLGLRRRRLITALQVIS